MRTVYIELKHIPPAFHRIAKSWAVWHGLYLRPSANKIGEESKDPSSYYYWHAAPPGMSSPTDIRLGEDDVYYHLVSEGGLFYIDEEQRSQRSRYWMFRNFDDAEKYMLFLLASGAYMMNRLGFLSIEWSNRGVAPWARVENLEPEVEYSEKFSVSIEGESGDRGWMKERDAIIFSQIARLAYEELDAKLREGIPPEWFTLEIAEA